jgi:hypothetical protein
MLAVLFIATLAAPASKPAYEFVEVESALEEGNARSLESRHKSTMHFVNLTSKELKLYWLDYSGRRRAYGTIPAGKEATRATYLTHPWLIASPHDNGLAIVHPRGKESTVLIDPMAAPKTADLEKHASQAGGAKTTLLFVNPTTKPVEFYWIDYAGKRHDRGTLPARSEVFQPTFAHHAWLVVNQDGKSQAIFVAKETHQSALVAPEIN